VSDLAAQPDRDTTLRAVAVAISQKIVSTIGDEVNARDFIGVVADKGYAKTTISLVNKSGEGVEKLRAVGLPAEISFELVFAGFNVDREAAFSPPQPGEPLPTLVVHALPPYAALNAQLKPYETWLYITRHLEKASDGIIHEVTHMLDNIRAENYMEHHPHRYKREAEQAATPQGISRNKYLRAYYNDPSEFNAHFQQGAFSLFGRLADMRERDRKFALSTFNRFLVEAKKERGFGPLYEFATPKNRRRLETRLWQTWDLWKDRDWA
jgi:hypothetical protein